MKIHARLNSIADRLYWPIPQLVLFAGLALASALTVAAEKPNILLIVLDDVGYSDIGAYGSRIRTPNMDRLAEQGLRYSNFHSTPTCSPSRAALLTGREPHRVGMGLITEFDLGPQAPAFRGRISPAAATLPEVLGDSVGAYAIGKWHLTPPGEQHAAGPFRHWPLGEGFDRFYGFLAGSTNQFRPGLVSDNSIIDVSYIADEVVTTDLVDHAITNLRDHVSLSPDRPFLMYLSLPGMHSPHQASDVYIEKNRGQFSQGWTALREQRFARQKAMGLIPRDSVLPESNRGIEDWDGLGDDEKILFERFQEVYAGMLEQTDEEIGRVLAALEQLGQWDNTLIMLLSDNGGSNAGYFDGAINSTAYNNGERGTLDDNLAVLDSIGRYGSGVNYPRGWAQLSNTPFPYYKSQPYGGGINVPLVMHWPAGIKEGGGVRHQYHHISDIMPTLLEVYGQDFPASLAGVKQMPVDGISMAYTLEQQDAPSHRNTQFYRMADHRGIYSDGWTAVALHRPGTATKKDRWALFNLEQDVTQSTDLARSNKEKLKELQLLWQSEAQRLGADMMLEPLMDKGRPPERPIREEFVLYPGTSHILEKSTPKVMGRSFRVSIALQRKTRQEQGVLLAHGSSQSGYVLYVKDNRLMME